MEKQLHKTVSVVKELPQALAERHQNGDEGFWTYISREITDTSGDIVRVDGVDFGLYHSPPESHMKILAQHLRVLPNGEAPIIGRVEDIVRSIVPYKGAMVKALAVYVSWARDGAGELTPLAKSYKDLYDGGYIDQMSVGIMVDEYAELPDTGGLDITKSTIFESSLVTIPANAAATVIKAVKDKLGEQLDITEAPIPEAKDLTVSTTKLGEVHVDIVPDLTLVKEMLKTLTDFAEKNNNSEPEPYALAELVGKAIDEKMAPIVASFNQLIERFDVLESAIVVLSASAKSQETADRKDDSRKALEEVHKKLDQTLRYLDK